MWNKRVKGNDRIEMIKQIKRIKDKRREIIKGNKR